eukprot:scaffold160155_cov42-Prasinocladus_malaysianus.AAC.1
MHKWNMLLSHLVSSVSSDGVLGSLLVSLDGPGGTGWGAYITRTEMQVAKEYTRCDLSTANFSSLLEFMSGGHVYVEHALVLDEADLLLSYGYEEDLKAIAPHIPRSVQCMLMSATLSEDVNRLQGLMLHNPVLLNLLDSKSEGKRPSV